MSTPNGSTPRLRNEHPAFGGQVTLRDSDAQTLLLERQLGDARATLQVRLDELATRLTVSDATGIEREILIAP